MSIRIKQHDLSDCGVACLASVAAHYGFILPLSKIRHDAGTHVHGTSLFGLIRAAEKLGLSAKGVKANPSGLPYIPLPAIAHLQQKSGEFHYVVIYRVSVKTIRVMNPADGKIHRISTAVFLEKWTGALLLLTPSPSFRHKKNKNSHISRFTDLLFPHRKILFQILFGAIVYTLLSLSTAIFVQKITDQVLNDSNISLLNTMGTIMLIILCLQFCINLTKNIYTLRTGQLIDAALISDFYSRLILLPQSFFDHMQIGEIHSRLNDAIKIRVFINDTFVGLLITLLLFGTSFSFLFTYHVKLTALLLSAFLFYGILYLVINWLNRRNQPKQVEDTAKFEAAFVESLSSIKTIKHFALETGITAKLDYKLSNCLESVYKTGKIAIFSTSASEFIAQFFVLLLLWMGSKYVILQEITPGALFSFYALSSYFTGPSSTLIAANKTIHEALIASERLYGLIDNDPEDLNTGIALPKDFNAGMRFEKVYFRYGTGVLVFENLNLHIKAGSLTAITGHSGSGKSTLILLLQGLYPLESGNIYFGHYNLNDVCICSLRKLMGIVPQHVELFSGSIAENIAAGDPQPDMRHVITLCRQLGIAAFIEALPLGYHTATGYHGCCLSGGQKQRIAFARALYHDPPVLFLDEATSSLDLIAEKQIQQVINRLIKQGKTIIIVSHRLNIIRQASRVVFMHQGKIIATGEHAVLMEKQKQYRQLWNTQ